MNLLCASYGNGRQECTPSQLIYELGIDYHGEE
jgi:hypothetical protein